MEFPEDVRELLKWQDDATLTCEVLHLPHGIECHHTVHIHDRVLVAKLDDVVPIAAVLAAIRLTNR